MDKVFADEAEVALMKAQDLSLDVLRTVKLFGRIPELVDLAAECDLVTGLTDIGTWSCLVWMELLRCMGRALVGEVSRLELSVIGLERLVVGIGLLLALFTVITDASLDFRDKLRLLSLDCLLETDFSLPLLPDNLLFVLIDLSLDRLL